MSAIPAIYLVFGVGVPAVVLANKGEAAGGTGALKSEGLSKDLENGKTLFSQPEALIPAIIEAWFNSSEKMMQPGRSLATVDRVASLEM